MHILEVVTKSLEGTLELGRQIGRVLRGGEVFEMLSDVGGGKTIFTKGLAKGLDIDEVIQSPTFTISRLYKARAGLELHHFDFYRLQEAGIVAAELEESLQLPNVVTVVEWGEVVHDVLPKSRIATSIVSIDDQSRKITFTFPEEFHYIAPIIAEYKNTRTVA